MIAARDITPVVMVGGQQVKSDFFSSIGRPKAFLKLISAHSPFQQTVLRALVFRKPVIVCHEKYRDLVHEQLAEIDVQPECIIFEPAEKGAAAALALACFALKQENSMLAVFPCYSLKMDPYREILEAAIYADERIVLIGKREGQEKAGYGYILPDIKRGERCHPVWAFIERPSKSGAMNLRKAKDALQSTGFLICRPRFFLEVLSSLEPNTFKICERAFYAAQKNKENMYIEAQNYLRLENGASGFSIIEKIRETCVVEIQNF